MKKNNRYRIYSLNLIAMLEKNGIPYELKQDTTEKVGKYYATTNEDISDVKEELYNNKELMDYLNAFRAVKKKISELRKENDSED